MRLRGNARSATILAAVLLSGIAAVPPLAGAAPAVSSTIGVVAPANLGGCGNCRLFQRRNGTGPSYKVPGGKWTITSWTAMGGGSARGRARLLVFRKTAPGQFKLVAQSALARIRAQGTTTTSVSIDVRGGDRIGIFTESNLVSGYGAMTTGRADSVLCSAKPGDLVGTGTTCPLSKLTNEQVNVAATLVPR